MAFHLKSDRLEAWLMFQYVLGVSFIFGSQWLKSFLKSTKRYDDKPETKALLQRLKVEFARKSFHIIGGTTIVVCYHWGMKSGSYSSAWQLDDLAPNHPPSYARVLSAVMVFVWAVEFIRIMYPGVNRYLMSTMRGIIREKEQLAASGMSFFLPGAVAAVVCYPPSEAMLAIMYLTLGDAAAGLGTAVGRIKVGQTTRRLEGTLGCFAICFVMSLFLMDGVSNTGGHTSLTLLAASASLCAALCELWAEVIRFDDNLFVPTVAGFLLHYLVNLIAPASPGQCSRVLALLAPFLPVPPNCMLPAS